MLTCAGFHLRFIQRHRPKEHRNHFGQRTGRAFAPGLSILLEKLGLPSIRPNGT
jgi:hypothetical protein